MPTPAPTPLAALDPTPSSLGRNGTTYVVLISLVAAMGGLLFGYDWVVIAGAKPFFEKYFVLESDNLRGWANSCALLGCLLGSLFSGGLSDRYGRKRLLLASGILFAVSSVLTGWAASFHAFVAWRIVGGVAIGMASNLSPVYIAEIGPARLRGRLVAMNQLTIVIGILAAQIVNWLIAEKVADGATAEMIRQSWNGQYGWRWMFVAVAVPSVLFFLLTLLVPESPRWLVKNGQEELSRRILTRIGGPEHAESELNEIRATLAHEETERVRWTDLFGPGLRKVLLIGCALAILQQWCGVNVIFNYAEEIFKQAGYDVNGILFTIMITGTVNLVFTFVAMGMVDRWGRRPLMLLGFLGIAASHLLLGWTYHMGLKGPFVLACTLAAIGCYAMTLAPVTWVLIAEIFPNRIRGAAVSVAVSALWIACFILTYTFPLLKGTVGAAWTFWIYAAICLAGCAFVARTVPETKGQSLEQIEKHWHD